MKRVLSQTGTYTFVGLHQRWGDQLRSICLGTLLVVDGYTGKGKNKHECTGIEGSERNSDDST